MTKRLFCTVLYDMRRYRMEGTAVVVKGKVTTVDVMQHVWEERIPFC